MIFGMKRQYWVIGLLLLGIVLVLNPLYLYPDGGGHERTYQVDTIENETMADMAISRSEKVVTCPGVRLCATEELILQEGSVEYEGHVQSFDDRFIQFEDPGWYPIVKIGRQPYLPKHEYDGEVSTLTLEEVSYMEAVEYVSEPAEDRPAEVREAASTGSVTVHGEPIEDFERYAIIEYDGDYYMRTAFSGTSHWTEDWLLFARALLYSLGVGLIFYAGRTYD